MKLPRRRFLQSALTASGAAALGGLDASAAGSGVAGRDLYELRAYRLRPEASRALLDSYLEEALIPALNARGINNVGVFTEPEATDGPAVWVLIPYSSLEAVVEVTGAINADPRVQSAGAEYLTSPTRENPAFARLDSWLHLAFAGMPRLEVPELSRNRQPRIFELRVYESFGERTALKKIEMFNAGEIEVMKAENLSPVFYGQALTGRDLPHLSYLLCGPDRATHEENFRAFLRHPVWVKLRDDPQYANTVSKVTSRFFVPTDYSQL